MRQNEVVVEMVRQGIPWEVGVGLGFLVFLIITLPFVFVAHSKRWHDRHHQHHSELMCDHCDRRAAGISITEKVERYPLRPLGSPRP